jgi:kynurenine formamidase
VFDFTKFRVGVEISLKDISDKISEIDCSFTGIGIFFNFGFGKYFNTPEYYYKKQPWISQDAAEYLASLKPSLIGYDLAMLDNPAHGYGCDLDSPIHKILLSKSIPLVENAFFPTRFSGHIKYSVTPLRLKKLDGSPVRFVGWVNDFKR